jgi:hypothetical protein
MRRHVAWANAHHTHEELATALWVDSPLPHPGWLVRREVFAAVGEYDESGTVPEDYEWLHRFFALAREGGVWRAGKPTGDPLLEWNDSPARLTRTHAAYGEKAFHEVKALNLVRWLGRSGRRPPIYLFGLGPKAKSFLPIFEKRIGPPYSIVDIHPGRIGMRYRGHPVWGLDRWRREVDRDDCLVLICVGTATAREECVRICRTEGVSYLAL